MKKGFKSVGSNNFLLPGSRLPRAAKTRGFPANPPSALGRGFWGLAAQNCCYQPFYILIRHCAFSATA